MNPNLAFISGLKVPRKLLLLAFASLLFAVTLPAQMLLFDRPPAGSSEYLSLPKTQDGFLADDFQVGIAKEDWVIDHIRVWADADPKAVSPRALGDIAKKISLIGGIAPDPPKPGQKDCDCHNLPVLKSASVEPDGDSTDNTDVKIKYVELPSGPSAWQIDFQGLRWSVPGGDAIQFGVLADTYSGYTWHAIGAPSTADSLRVFSSAGKLLSQFHRDPPASMNIQVWGHLLARISIRPDGQKLRVILWNTPGVDTAQVDSSTLRFGPRNASPRDVRKDDANPTGKLALVMDFSIAESGIAPHSLNACLTGKRSDGAPFEGCDLLPH